MKNYIIVINGSPQSGKDTFVNFCKKNSKRFNIYNMSSVDMVYVAAKLLGWDNIKDEKGRQFLSDLKDLSTKNYNGPLEYMLNKIKTFESPYNFFVPYIAFFHVREPKEIEKFIYTVGEAKTLLIKRKNLIEFNNHADLEVSQYSGYNFVIDNNGTLEDLEYKAIKFLEIFK